MPDSERVEARTAAPRGDQRPATSRSGSPERDFLHARGARIPAVLTPADAIAMQRALGNQAVTGVLRAWRPCQYRQSTLVVQRSVTVGKVTYGPGRQKDFVGELTFALAKGGYRLNNRVLRVAVGGLYGKYTEPKHAAHTRPGAIQDEADVANRLTKEEFSDFAHLVEYLANNDMVAATLPNVGSTRFRARTLGKRPPWNSFLRRLRKEHKMSTGISGQAARHVIPSHVLGYAVEKWAPTPAEVGAFYKSANINQPVPATAKAAQRHLWLVLHNHTGNLWLGETKANTVIALVAPALEKLQSALANIGTGDPVQAVHGILTDMVNKVLDTPAAQKAAAKSNSLHRLWQETMQTIGAIIDSHRLVLQDATSAGVRNVFHEVMEELDASLDDMFFQVELDPFTGQSVSAMVREWNAARDIYKRLTSNDRDAIADAMREFLKTTFKGTMSPSQPIAPMVVDVSSIPSHQSLSTPDVVMQ